MAHILLFDVPGGNDFAVMDDALALGHEVTFCTCDLAHYTRMGSEIIEQVTLAQHIVDVPSTDEEALMRRLDEIHQKTPFHAVICMIDIRLLAAAQAAQRLGLRFLSPDVVKLTRDKTAVRAKLMESGIAQPPFAQAATPAELLIALEKTGYPAIIKPSDGYGSQSLYHLSGPESLDSISAALFADKEGIDYGLGVHSNRLYSVEPYMAGQLIGVDVFSDGDSRLMLGINAKKMFPPPSFAIAGSTFPSDQFDYEAIQERAFAILDAINFNFGAAHIEMIIHGEALYLVEVNARLVSAQIPYQMAYAFERSIYVDLIDLHLGTKVVDLVPFQRNAFSVTRWITSVQAGQLDELVLPEHPDPNIRRIVIFKAVGESVAPPLSNGDRIGYVIATAPTEAEAVQIAESYISAVYIKILDCTI